MNQKRSKVREQGDRKRNKNKLFIKTFLITVGVFSLLVLSGWVFIRVWVRPPDIPQITAVDLDSAASLPAEGNEEDLSVGGGLHAPEGFTSEDRKESFYTFLIVGKDEGVSMDTIMIASYDGVNETASIVGIPRDSLVNVKRRVKKINAAYAAGTLYGGGKDGGIDQLKREIKTIIGFTPDFYVMVDLEAFVKIVDTVGGLEVDVPFDMNYDDADLHIHIRKGRQTLDGNEALHFARYRKGNNSKDTISDYQRIENQQALIKAGLSALMKPANLLRISDFIEIFDENVYSDIKVENMLWFAEQMSKVRGTDALSTYTLPTIGTSGPPSYYEYLDAPSIAELVNETINPYKKNIEVKDLDIITSG